MDSDINYKIYPVKPKFGLSFSKKAAVRSLLHCNLTMQMPWKISFLFPLNEYFL